jgi:hypothetical protein
MKTQIYQIGVFTRHFRLPNLISAGILILFGLFPVKSFSQVIKVVSPSTNVSYILPDPDSLLNSAAVLGAVTTAEMAGKALDADAANEKTVLITAENDYSTAQTMKSNYLAALDDYTKKGYNPYMTDYNSYTPNMQNYNETLSRHNTAVAANNALAPEQRNAANVASLNSEKTELDNWKVKLDTWKSNLDIAKAKLDAQRAILLDQKQQYDTANQSAADKLRASRLKLKGILDQLILCESYAQKCNKLLVAKFNYSGTSATGYFGTPVYKESIDDLNTNLEKLKSLSGMVWDGN